MGLAVARSRSYRCAAGAFTILIGVRWDALGRGKSAVMASISEPFIRRPVGTTLLAIGLFLVGGVAYQFLPVAAVPNVDFPSIRVSATRPGADPSVMAATVAAPLERRLGEIAG